MPQAVGAPLALGAASASSRRPLRVFVSAACLVVLVAAAMIILILPDYAADAGPIAVMVGSLVSGTLILRGARAYIDRERLAWSLVGGGFVFAGLGVLVYALLLLFVELPSFGPYDLVFLSAYAVTLTGFALMPHLGSVLRSRARVMLDGIIGAVAMTTLLATLFLPSLDHFSSATGWERVAGLAYPVLDTVAVVVALIVTIRRSSWRFDIRIALLGIGMVLQVAGDLSLLSSGVGQSFAEAEPNFLFFVLAQICYLGVGTWIGHRPRPREYADKRQALWPMLAPYGAVGLLAWLVTAELVASDLTREALALLLVAVAVVGLVIIRQAVALKEYRSLVEERRKSLVASVSHELRTPLTAMIGFLDVMRDPNIPMGEEERLELNNVVHQQATYMARIVADLLLLARDSAGPVLKESVVAMEKLVSDSVWSGRTSPVGLEVEVEPGLYAYLDPDRTRQVLDNLVTNAIRYGRGHVYVSAASIDNDIVIEVHDDGPGIPRKYELAIWEQFERGANRLNANVPGSGIGLAVVELIVRRHGGTATHERSRRMAGACFRIVLPERRRPAPAPVVPRAEGLRAPMPAR